MLHQTDTVAEFRWIFSFGRAKRWACARRFDVPKSFIGAFDEGGRYHDTLPACLGCMVGLR